MASFFSSRRATERETGRSTAENIGPHRGAYTHTHAHSRHVTRIDNVSPPRIVGLFARRCARARAPIDSVQARGKALSSREPHVGCLPAANMSQRAANNRINGREKKHAPAAEGLKLISIARAPGKLFEQTTGCRM